MKQLNRIKEQGYTGKWLFEQFNKDIAIVSGWCMNRVQPSIKTIDEVSTIHDINRQ